MNLKRLYVRMRSFPQARLVSELLLAVDPSSLTELRDRGLLAYHLEDFHAALDKLLSMMAAGSPRSPSATPWIGRRGRTRTPESLGRGVEGKLLLDVPPLSERGTGLLQMWRR